MAQAAVTQVDVLDRVAAEDRARVEVYSLLATLLSSAPTADTLAAIGRLTATDGPFGAAIGTLARVARTVTQPAARSEYQEVFIGLGRGELVPYASYYLTGFLQEKPLAELRRDMARLGAARSEDTRDPEDHVAAVLELMAGLIDGRFGEPASLDEQKRFFDRHIGSWMSVFFRDLEGATASVFYAPVGSLGRAFLDIEHGAFDMV